MKHLKQVRTFAVESIFEGRNYVGIFDHKTGELIKHTYGADEHEQRKEAQEEQQTQVNKSQLQLF